VPTPGLLYKDRVHETTATTGTGALTLGGAVQDFQSFNTAFVNGQDVYYTIYGGVDWEVGKGTFTSPSTLSRDQVFDSSNAGALVNLPAGTHFVFCDLPALSICDRGMSISMSMHMMPR
jgi:hypothetical protein